MTVLNTLDESLQHISQKREPIFTSDTEGPQAPEKEMGPAQMPPLEGCELLSSELSSEDHTSSLPWTLSGRQSDPLCEKHWKDPEKVLPIFCKAYKLLVLC